MILYYELYPLYYHCYFKIITDNCHVSNAKYSNVHSKILAKGNWILSHVWCTYVENLEVNILFDFI